MNKHAKPIIFLVFGIVVIAAGIITGFNIKKSIEDRSVNVAFYGLDEEYVELIKEKISSEEKVIINYDVIAPSAMELSTITKKYDMLFTWKGEVTDALSESAEKIPSKILENIPRSLRNEKCVPILLNHFELDLYKPVVDKLGLKPGENYVQFLDYLSTAKDYVFSPFFTNGGDDRTLLALLGSFIEAEGGVTAYENFLDSLKKAESLSDVLDVELGALQKGEKITLRSILDMVKNWPAEGITHPQWYNGNLVDLNVFAEDNQIAAFFSNLISHRDMKYKVISNFETVRMPSLSDNVDHGLIAPAISCVLITDNANGKKILGSLLSMDTQTEMAMKTMLAPVHYRAETYDIQADDVRFWAASCAGGAMPDPALSIYQRKPEALAEMAREIRSYLR